MKRIRKTMNSIKANQRVGYDYMFTAEEVVQLLNHMVELSDYDISLDKSSNGILKITVGDSVYQIIDTALSEHR